MKVSCGLLALVLSGCGYVVRGGELTGQVKDVDQVTPLICGDFKTADISLGIMRNGVGSMSTQDVKVYVTRDDQYELLKQATNSGKLVKVTYDQRRLTFCVPDVWVTSVEVLP
jgi:hypothetical protein